VNCRPLKQLPRPMLTPARSFPLNHTGSPPAAKFATEPRQRSSLYAIASTSALAKARANFQQSMVIPNVIGFAQNTSRYLRTGLRLNHSGGNRGAEVRVLRKVGRSLSAVGATMEPVQLIDDRACGCTASSDLEIRTRPPCGRRGYGRDRRSRSRRRDAHETSRLRYRTRSC
jgi:hypothetical protein